MSSFNEPTLLAEAAATRNLCGEPPIELIGGSLSIADIVAAASGKRGVVVPPMLWSRVRESHTRLADASARVPVYGANTGVGANKSVTVDSRGQEAVSMRLLRSHCAGIGEVLDSEVTRAAMVVRLNQILVGNSGVSERLARGLADAVATDALPTIHSLGGLGTADIAQLAELALTLAGERPWCSGQIPPVRIADTDALPFMSSSAVTLAGAALAVYECEQILVAAELVFSMSFMGMRGSVEALAPEVHRARPQPHQEQVAARLRAMVAEQADQSHIVQDSFALRVFPAVLGTAWDALTRLRSAVELECSSGSENPLVLHDGVKHHGLFHLAEVASLLDQLRLALASFFTLSSSRVSAMTDPAATGRTQFLSDGAPGSSGLMIGEYVVNDALASIRTLSTPTTSAAISISLGIENHASYATQGVRQLREQLKLGWWVVGVEALSAIRCLRGTTIEELPCTAIHQYLHLAEAVNSDETDRPMNEDLLPIIDALKSIVVP